MLRAVVSREYRAWRSAIHRIARGRGGADSVHQLRQRTRRLREALRFLDYKNEKLSQLSHLLGPARDVEMLWQRLFAGRHPSLERRRILLLIDRQRRVVNRRLSHHLRSPNVRSLIRTLATIQPKTPFSREEEKERTRSALKNALKRLNRWWKERPSHPKPLYLHALRRAIRRLRYAAELSVLLDRKHLEALAGTAARWQSRLGDYQDARIAVRLLRPIHNKESRRMIKHFRETEHETAKTFWKKWRKKGWRKLKGMAKKAMSLNSD